MKVEIGGGRLLTNGYVNLDPGHGHGEWKRYAQETPWPTGDNTVDTIRASHVLEHIPAGMDDRVRVMNEAWRVMCPGGHFNIIGPVMMVEGKLVEGWWPWADPTHVSFWCYPESWHYFDGTFLPNADYGIKQWVWGAGRVEGGWEAHVTLVKP